jgi:hydrogenase maturation protease
VQVLVAAFGNELRGDDGFGIAVLRRLEAGAAAAASPHEVRLVEVGTGGLWLAQQLLSPCDRLIIIDAMTRGQVPGTVSVLQVEEVPETRDVDMHAAVPARALAIARALGALPAETYLVCCEPAEVDEMQWELTPPVRAAVDVAAAEVQALMECPS